MHPAPAPPLAASTSGDIESLNPGTATPTEQTPLLSSTSSATLNNASSVSSRSRRASTASSSSATPNHRIGPWRAIAVAVSLWLLIFLQASNMSGMTMVQGKIAEDLQAYEAAMWFTSAYLIPMSSLAPVAGRLATIFPPRSLVLPVSVFIALGSLVCARATTFGAFIAGRVIAGLGGAGVLTLAVILVLELTSKKTRGVFVGLVNAGFTLGVSFGAVVYGALLPVIGWRPLFMVQVPFAVVAGLGVYLSMPAMDSGGKTKTGSVKQRLARIDYLGAILLTLTIVLFLYGLAGDIQALPLVMSLVTLLLFVTVEYRIAADPIIPLKVLSSRGVLLSCLAQLGLMSARWSVLFYAPIFMLAVRGASPAAAGSVLLPTNFGFGLGGVIVGWLHVRRSGAFWLPSIMSVAFFSASLYALSLVATPHPSVAAFIVVVLVNGLAIGAGLNYTLAHILHLSHEDTQYVTTSLLATFRGFGGSFGTAIGGGIFYRLLRSDLTSGFLELDGGDKLSPERKRLVSRLLGTPGLVFGGGLNPEEQDIAVTGYAGASRGVWQAAAVLGVAMIAIQAATGWTAPGKEEEEDVIDEEEARVNLTENEGVGEA
ncbi:Fc.00g101860.m01.CDS01 [Cosmosporella sp. VM-42]